MDTHWFCSACGNSWRGIPYSDAKVHVVVCPNCEQWYIEEVKDGNSGEAALGRFSPRVFLRYILIIGRAGLLIIGSLAGIVVILIVAGLSWLSDLLFGRNR